MPADLVPAHGSDHERDAKFRRDPAEFPRRFATAVADAYRIRGVTLDLARQVLLKNGQQLRLRTKSYEVLLYLVRHAGRVVGKQELLDAVWGGVAVTEDSLVQCLVEVRRALEAQAASSNVPATEFAILHVGLGWHEEALDWLERGLDQRSRWMEIIGVLLVLEPLRSHPRFRTILQAMQLPDPS
jgi:hypothetical protein